MRIHLTLAAGVMLAVSACSGGTSTSTVNAGPSVTPRAATTSAAAPTQDPDSETGLAESMLLTLSDFPSGTIEKPRTAPDPGLDVCQQKHPAGSTGYADTAEFSRSGSQSDIEEQLYLFSSTQDATAWYGGNYKAAVPGCVVNEINSGKFNSGDTRVHDASINETSFPAPAGTQLSAYRVEYSVDTGPTSGLVVTIDGAVVLVGRVVYELDGGPSGFSSGELSPFLERAVATIRQKIGP